MKKRTISLISAAALIVSSIAACGSQEAAAPTSGGSSPDSPAQVTEGADVTAAPAETLAIDTIEKKDFGGREFKAVSTNQSNNQVDIVAEEENGDILNDLVYRRNTQFEEMYNVKIQASGMDYGSINQIAMKAAQAGDNPYDLYMTNFTAYTLATGGYLIPWSSISSMDISQPWWDQAAVKELSIAGNSYLITGDISPTGLLHSECILINKNLFEARSMDYQYQTAFDGNWTIDKMIDLSKGLSEDIDGDGRFKDKTDLFSFTLWFDGGTALLYGQGEYMSQKDDKDIPSVKFDVESISSRYDNIYRLVIDNNANYSKTNHEMTYTVFKQSRAYFCDIMFIKIGMFLRDMEDDFGVLPLPKYDESQPMYQTNVSGAATALIMPVSCPDPEDVGLLIDAYAAMAYDSITESLFDVIASVKNTRDEESSRMTQLVIRNRVFDPVRMYYVDGHNIADDLLAKKSNDVASYLAKYEPKAIAAMETLVEAFTENN